MIIELIIALIAGIVAGLITGLLPGIHINLVASFILLFVVSHSNLAIPLSVFIAVLSITHVIIDFIPTTLLGVPNEDNFLSILPAHSLVLQGKAYEAMRLAFLGCIVALPVFLLIIPIYLFLLPHIYLLIEKTIPYVLVLSSVYLILRSRNILGGFVIFVLAGTLGFFAFNLPVKEPLLPLLSGLFGISSLFSGLSENIIGTKQQTNKFLYEKKKFVKPTIVASLIAPIFSFFPAIGAGHISLFSSEITQHTPKQFIFLNGFCAAIAMNLSIVAAYSIEKTRTGTAVAIKSLLSPFSSNLLILIIAAIVISTVMVYFIAIHLSKNIINLYNKINYKNIALCTLLFVIATNMFITNSLGLVILVCSASLGLLAIYCNISRIQLMGCLLLPTIIYYFV